MQLVCVAEVTTEHELKLDENIKNKLHPGEKVKIKIETIDEKKEQNRLKAIKRLKEISMSSRLGLYNEKVSREDAYSKDIFPGI